MKREWFKILVILFILLSLCANYHLFPLSMASDSRRCCRIPPLKYRVQYNRSRHRFHLTYLAFNTLSGTLLCHNILCKIWSWIHQSRRCHYTEWDTVNFPPTNTPTLVLPRLYRHHTRSRASLLPSPPTNLTTTRVFFLSTSSRLSIAYLLISTAYPPTTAPRIYACHAPLSLLSPSSTHSQPRARFAFMGQGCRQPSTQ